MILNSIRLRKPCSVLLMVITVLISSCKQSRLEVDISNISFKLQIDRFERDLFKVDTINLKQGVARLEKKYPEFLPLFIENIASLGKMHDSTDMLQLGHFTSNKDLKILKHDVDSVYPNIITQQHALENAFKHVIYYYPRVKLPRVITFISGFNNAVVNTNSDLAIGLDMFMGSRYPYYRAVQFPRYIARTLSPEYLPVTAMKGFSRQLFAPSPAETNLLGEMIYEGKMLYFLDALFPSVPDTLKIAYTGKQLSWCRNNEENIWAYAVENDKLFGSEKKVHENFFSEGPFTQGLAAESAPRLGMYIGWQLVKQYMEKNQTVTVQQLMAETDDNKILKGAEYKP